MYEPLERFEVKNLRLQFREGMTKGLLQKRRRGREGGFNFISRAKLCI